MAEHDPYSRVEYRKLIAWPERIRREWPLLEEVLSSGPSRRVLEVGCGPGQHARALAEAGFEVVAVDRSEAMIADATEEPVPEGLTFVLGDMSEVDRLVEGTFGAALRSLRGARRDRHPARSPAPAEAELGRFKRSW